MIVCWHFYNIPCFCIWCDSPLLIRKLICAFDILHINLIKYKFIYTKNKTLLKAVFHLLPIHSISKSFLLYLRCWIVISFVSRIIFVTKIAKPEICHYGIYIMDFPINYQVSFCVVECTGFPLNCCRYMAAITTCTS